MKRVYLCGAINGKSDAECREWREWFKQHHGFLWLDPMSRDIRGKEDELGDETADKDLEEVESSDALLLNAWTPGWGSCSELVWAWLAHIPTVTICQPPVSPWLRKWSDHMVRTKEEALEVLRGLTSSV